MQEIYEYVNRAFHLEDTQINIATLNGEIHRIGSGHIGIIAGPCSVENYEQIITIAKAVKKAGATFLRGGAFKPRTSPYTFQGLGKEGILLLLSAKKETGLPIVSEIMDIKYIDLFNEVDVIQVGARNMQNFTLLEELSHCQKPILLKRAFSSTIKEFLLSAEYLLSGGNSNIILCERGIRTFETYTRNTLDLSAIPILKRETHLPVIVDPSHATGLSWIVPAMAKSAIACGADGLMIEVHNDPENALCDGEQSISPETFSNLMNVLCKYAEIEGKTVGSLANC